MNQLFDGHKTARQAAELQSKKEQSEVWVLKANIGGLKYVVTKDITNLPQGAKVLEYFKNGNLQK